MRVGLTLILRGVAGLASSGISIVCNEMRNGISVVIGMVLPGPNDLISGVTLWLSIRMVWANGIIAFRATITVGVMLVLMFMFMFIFIAMAMLMFIFIFMFMFMMLVFSSGICAAVHHLGRVMHGCNH